MADTTGTSWQQIKSGDRHGTQNYGQASDGTGTSGNLPKFNPDGSLTDSGIAASGIGGGGATWVQEIPSGALNGSNATFTLTNAPSANSLTLFLNGVEQVPGGIDFTLSGSTITMRVAPKARDTGYFVAKYTH